LIQSRSALALCFAAGAIAVVAFGDWSLAPIPVLSLALLSWFWLRAASARMAAWQGFSFGCGLFLCGVSWVYVSLHTFGMMPAPLAALATLLFCFLLAAFPALAGYLQVRFFGTLSPALRLLAVIPALWLLSEWARGWFLTGFPWLSFGYSQLDAPLAGFAPLIGVYGLSLLSAIAAGAITLLFIERGRARITPVALLLVLIASGAVLNRAHWTDANGAPLQVSLLQGNIAQALKFIPGRYEQTLATYARLAEQSSAQLIVMPETAIPRFFDQVDPAYIEGLKQHALAQHGDMLVPVPIEDGQGHFYNAVLSFGRSPTQAYAKSHLVPFGEFVPAGFGWIIHILHIPLSDFSRGGIHQQPLDVAGQRVAINICYEDAFGEEIIRQLPQATLLVNVSNVAWFGDSLAPEQHLRMSRMRALESGRYMLRATNTGVTAIIDQRGVVQARLPDFREGVLNGQAQGYSGATLYVRCGNWITVMAATLLLAGALLARRARRILLARSATEAAGR
jgi:apolipoprotein N-acyltransferase